MYLGGRYGVLRKLECCTGTCERDGRMGEWECWKCGWECRPSLSMPACRFWLGDRLTAETESMASSGMQHGPPVSELVTKGRRPSCEDSSIGTRSLATHCSRDEAFWSHSEARPNRRTGELSSCECRVAARVLTARVYAGESALCSLQAVDGVFRPSYAPPLYMSRRHPCDIISAARAPASSGAIRAVMCSIRSTEE